MKIRHLVAAAAASLAFGAPAQADWAPDGPINFHIAFGAGGSTDTLGRAIARAMEEQTGWNVIVENKPGGGGVAMFSSMMSARPDGRTIGIGVTIPILINLARRGDTLPFKADSFDYLATVTLGPLAIAATPDKPFSDFAGLVEYAREKGSAIVGIDAPPQEIILRAAMADLGVTFRIVNHNSGSEIIQSMLGGHIDAGFVAGAHIPYLASGDLKLLATATATAHGYAPDVPSLREQGFDYGFEPYWYIAAPKGLSDAARDSLAKAIDAAIHSDIASEVIVNAFQSEPQNLGPDGTRDKMVNGLSEVMEMLSKVN